MKSGAEVAFIAPGSYGTREVLVSGLERGREDLVVLLHGVHGCADMTAGNKYGDLARMLDASGFDALMVQTSRNRFDRETFGDDRDAWSRDAFRGKSYAMDFFDALSGLSEVLRRYPGRKLWLWGFSLGGIHWTMAAGDMAGEILPAAGLEDPLGRMPLLEGIVLSGSGVRIASSDNPILYLPILDSLPPEELLLEAAIRVKTRSVLAFYGSEDVTFTEHACRRLQGLIPATEKKAFHVLPGVDHPFRNVAGKSSIDPLKTMVEAVTVVEVS